MINNGFHTLSLIFRQEAMFEILRSAASYKILIDLMTQYGLVTPGNISDMG